jgi:hypothetical protein
MEVEEINRKKDGFYHGNPTFGLLLVAQTSEKGPMFQQFGW